MLYMFIASGLPSNSSEHHLKILNIGKVSVYIWGTSPVYMTCASLLNARASSYLEWFRRKPSSNLTVSMASFLYLSWSIVGKYSPSSNWKLKPPIIGFGMNSGGMTREYGKYPTSSIHAKVSVIVAPLTASNLGYPKILAKACLRGLILLTFSK